MMRNTVLLIALLSLHTAISPCQELKAQRALQQVDLDLTLQSKSNFRGAVLVGLNGRILFEKGYGLADQQWMAPNSATTKFRIASLTKQFTAACILLLQERKKIAVTDPISRYVDDLPENWRRITLHQLLTHTSGIPNYAGMAATETLNRTGAKPQQLVAVAATEMLEFKPGTKLHYSNTGYVLLGMAIERASGETYSHFLQSNIFGPLGMTDSGYDDASTVLNQRASGYMSKDGAAVINADFIDMSVPYAAGGIYSTVEDLFKWNEALATGKLLLPTSLEQMFAIYPETLYQGQHYGYGVVLAQRFGKTLNYHGGGVSGFESVLQRYPKEGLCIVVLENVDPATPWETADHIASLIFGESAR